MHTAEHALKPTVLLGAEEFAILAMGTAASDTRPRWRDIVTAILLSALRRARRRFHVRR